MDLMIQNGDHVTDENNQPIEIFSIEEAVQRAAIIFSTAKGFFRYDREFGIDIAAITPDSSREKVTLICAEALQGREDFILTDASIDKRGNDYYLCFEVEWNDMRGLGSVRLF